MTFNRFFLTALSLLTIGFSFGQKENADEWSELQTTDGIIISYTKGECNLPSQASYTEEIYLKFTNTNDYTVYVDWSYDVTYGTRCFNCDGQNEEFKTTIKIPANESVQGECGDKNDFRMRLFSKFLRMENPDSLKEFHLRDVEVRQLIEE